MGYNFAYTVVRESMNLVLAETNNEFKLVTLAKPN
jgi:hypothetical protein